MTDTPAPPVSYVYVASSWRNPAQPAVCAALADAHIDHYDFKNPPGGEGFSWKQVKSEGGPASEARCEHCGAPIVYARYRDVGSYEPDYDPSNDPTIWRHTRNGYASCYLGETFAAPKKGSDWEQADEYLAMVNHPRAVEGFTADFSAMQKADAFVLVLPCGKSAHLELGWAVGAGKRTAILLEDPVEPELMYRMVDLMTTDITELLGWLGATTRSEGPSSEGAKAEHLAHHTSKETS